MLKYINKEIYVYINQCIPYRPNDSRRRSGHLSHKARSLYIYIYIYIYTHHIGLHMCIDLYLVQSDSLKRIERLSRRARIHI